MSILAPASLQKATENISPQTSKTRAANGLLCFLPLTSNHLVGRGRDPDSRGEGEGSAPDSWAFTILPPSTQGHMWCEVLEIMITKRKHGPVLAELVDWGGGGEELKIAPVWASSHSSKFHEGEEWGATGN